VDTPYHKAQHAMADLKSAVYDLLAQQEGAGLTNAAIGRALGIYLGHEGHEGHISRTVLHLMSQEGVVEQLEPRGPWRIAK